MRDEIIEGQIKRAREAFVLDIRDAKGQAICDLASSHHGNIPCHIFSITHGSFNICVCVQFDNAPVGAPPVRWVVRIPFPARVPWIDEKIDSEVATMMYMAEKTTIPVPKIHAWSYEADSPIGHAFIIMDYIQGVPLSALHFRMSEKWLPTSNGRSPALARAYDQLADVFIQLRGLEFPEIGALGLPTPESPGIAIRHRPLSVEVALQEVEHLDPTFLFPEKTTFKTTRDYLTALVKLGFNRVRKTRNLGMDSWEGVSEVIFAYEEFYKKVRNEWTYYFNKNKTNEGPFVLMHGDMALHGSNLLWDEKMNLVAVIDWEWCHTVPVSCFTPPTWLNGFFPNPIRQMCIFGIFYTAEINIFCDTIAKRAQMHFPKSRLAEEWRDLPREPYRSLLLGLFYPETIGEIYWDFMIFQIFNRPQSEVADRRLKKYLERPDIKAFIDRRMADQEKYNEEIDADIDEYGDSVHCACWNCQREEQNFNILRELPRLSPPSSPGCESR